MSVTINIASQTAVLADGKWRSANETLRELLNAHLESVQLEVGGHLPPSEREIQLARLAVKTFDGKIIDVQRHPDGPTRTPDGQQIVF